MNGHRTKSSRAALEERLEQVEEMLCAGVALERVQRKIADDYGVSTRQARNYIARVYTRWQQQSKQDAPHRREKLYRMAERFYARALANKQYTAAANALALLAKMSGAFTAQEPKRGSVLETIGPVPDDPTLGLVYAQRVMLLALEEVVGSPTIEPERRLRLISELGGRIGMTYAKTLMEAKLDEVAGRLAPPADAADELEADTTPWPSTSRLGSGDDRQLPVRRPGDQAPPGEDR